MRCEILLLAAITCSLASETVTYDEDAVDVAPFREATENDITYLFYNRHHPRGLRVHINDPDFEISLGTAFDPNQNTVVLIHGWRGDYNEDFNTQVRLALLQATNVNVIKVDWSPLAGLTYARALSAVPSTGRFVAHILEKLNHIYRYSYENVTLIGFSLGAHVAGCAGAVLRGKVAEIIGLDPAGPDVSHTDHDLALDPSDAQYVTAIHTNAGQLGIQEAVGHSDFYVNGGSRQPGCIEIFGTCSHGRAHAYMAESILNNRFVSKQCNSYDEYTRGRCQGREALMGGYPLDTSAHGIFYLTTNRRSPFGQG